MVLIVPTISSFMVYDAIGLNRTSDENFFIFLGAAILHHLVGVSLGLFGGCVFSNMKVAQGVMPQRILPFMMFAGFFTNRDSIPSWIAWMEYLSPMKYFYEIVITNEYEGRGFEPNPVDYYFNFEMGIEQSFIILIIMTVTLRVLGFFALKGLLRTLE